MQLLAFLVVTSGSSTRATEIRGSVVGVHDGDSLTLLTAEKVQIKVRLEGIDASELAASPKRMKGRKKSAPSSCEAKTLLQALDVELFCQPVKNNVFLLTPSHEVRAERRICTSEQFWYANGENCSVEE